MAWHISNQIEKHNTPPDRRRYLFPHGKTGTPLFYALMSRSRGKGSLVSWGFTGAVLTGQGKDTFSLKNAFLSRTPHSKGFLAVGFLYYLCSCRYNCEIPVAHIGRQTVKLPPPGRFFRFHVREKELVYRHI